MREEILESFWDLTGIRHKWFRQKNFYRKVLQFLPMVQLVDLSEEVTS